MTSAPAMVRIRVVICHLFNMCLRCFLSSGICINGSRHGGDGFPSSSVLITWRDEVAPHSPTFTSLMPLQMTIGAVTIRLSFKFPDPAPAPDATADKKAERHKEGRQQFVEDFVSGVSAFPRTVPFVAFSPSCPFCQTFVHKND
jgi:hypothetical protein